MQKHWYAVLAVVIFAGCAPSTPWGPPGTLAPQGSGWMSPAAATSDLLYVTDVGTNSVYAYTYPEGALAGTLTGFDSPVRDCSDIAGNVYVTNTNAETVLEYAHGGESPIATFKDKGFLPVDCSVDPTTGTLAVTNYGPSGSNTGSVAIYPRAGKAPKVYRAANVQAYLFCAYDNSGNLYVDGLNDSYDFLLIELPKGATKFIRIKLHQSFSAWGGVQTTGDYVAIGDGSSTIYEFAIRGSKAIEKKAVALRHAVNVVQFWVGLSSFVAPDGPNGGDHDVGLWTPDGLLKKTIGKSSLKNPSGATVSIAK